MSFASYSESRGQFKIQQMAFMLIALVVFFVLIGLLYFTLQINSVKNNANDVLYLESIARTHALKSTPEFAWTVASCHSCVDFDKALALKEQRMYAEFWQVPFLKLRILDGSTKDVECTRTNYPKCNTVSIVNTSESYRAERAYVALCRTTSEGPSCYLGTISVGAKVK